jgi:hypothetical protein
MRDNNSRDVVSRAGGKVPEPSVVLLLGFGAATLTALGRLVTDKRRGDM